jgi:pectinesterase
MFNRLLILFLIIHIQTFITTSIATNSFPADTSYTTFQVWQKIVKKYPEAKIVPAIHNLSVTESYDLVYASVLNSENTKRDLCLDIFSPAQKGKYPALIMIHGGGWRSGNKKMERPMAQRIALQGYVTVPVDYRLSTEALYPAAIYDIKAVVRWIKVNSERFNIDTARIAIEGNSAGGQLATLVGMTNGIAKFEGNLGLSSASSNVHAVIDIDGVVDFLAPASLNLPRKADSPDVYWLGGNFEEKPQVWKEASPIFWVNDRSVPVLFITSSQFRFSAGRGEMIDLLNQNKVYNETINIPDSPHSFWLLKPWFDPTTSYIVAFLDKLFK